MKTWRLKKGADRRLRQGHPWVFSGEVAHSTKEALPGEVVELVDCNNHFLAYGYVSPTSQISFRKLSANSRDKNVLSAEFFIDRLKAARLHRLQAGWTQFSHRWLYAEADGVPGLIIDCFLSDSQGWIVVVQASTAGIEKALPEVYEAITSFSHEFGLLSIVEASSSQSRRLEGLEIKPKRLVQGDVSDLEQVTICLTDGMRLECDILKGQKTGFFLDQQWNTRLLRSQVQRQFKGSDQPVRVLDICCYHGQWAAQTASALRQVEVEGEVTLLDVSEAALQVAERNLRGLAAKTEAVVADALDGLEQLPPEHYDVVICDPPAFVKKKNDFEAGRRAYTKLNRDAMKRVRPGGIFVASSCSGLVKNEDWRQILAESSQKAGRMFKISVVGGHAPDHPLRPEFPEGEYLKCWIGNIHYPF